MSNYDEIEITNVADMTDLTDKFDFVITRAVEIKKADKEEMHRLIVSARAALDKQEYIHWQSIMNLVRARWDKL